MTGEPLLTFLRKQPVCHPLELPDTESFLERGRYDRDSFYRSPFPYVSPTKIHSTLEHPLAQTMVCQANRPLYWGMRRHPKLATRIRCRALSALGKKEHLEAARYLVSHGCYREEVQTGLLFLLFLGQPQDLDAARILARNEAFTPYAVGIIARHSSDRDSELRELLAHLNGKAKEDVTKLLLKNPTAENVEAALDDGFPELALPIWYWRWRDDDLLEEPYRLWSSSTKLWMKSAKLQESLLSKPKLASRAAYVCRDENFQLRALAGPRMLEHFFLDMSAEDNWTPHVLQALDDADDFQRRQGWIAARLLDWDLDALLEQRKPQYSDYVAWEECVPYLKRPGHLAQFEWVESEDSPQFELGLCPRRWATARTFEAVLRGISAFPGIRADLVPSGLSHPVLSVRLAALGVAAVWPDDTFVSQVLEVRESDPVRAVRERAALVAGRGPIESERRASLERALRNIRVVPNHLIDQFLDAPVLEKYVTEEHSVNYVRFADHLNQPQGWTVAENFNGEHWVIDLDSRCRHLLSAERV